jgi:NADP-dependent 3-hydroxy acid dehydrogenase YdfG
MESILNAQRKTAVVTRALSRIGLDIAKALFGQGWNMVGNARTQPRLDTAAAQLDTAKRLLDGTIDPFARVDLLIEEGELDNWGWGGLPGSELRRRRAAGNT